MYSPRPPSLRALLPVPLAAALALACGGDDGQAGESGGSEEAEADIGASESESESSGSESESGESEADSSASSESDSESESGGVELGPAVLRVNVGGPAVGDFIADDAQGSAYLASPDTQPFTLDSVSPDASVPEDLPLDVLLSGRREPAALEGGTGQLRYAFPVEPGTYQLRLHFSGEAPEGAAAQLVVDGLAVGDPLSLTALTAGGSAATVVHEITAEAWLDIELIRTPYAAMPQLSAIELFGEGSLRDGPAGARFHITTAGGGDGSSLDSPASLAQLPSLLAAAAPGDEIWIHAGDEDYAVSSELSLSGAGTQDLPVVIRGVGPSGWHDPGRPRIVGTRADPWTPEGDTGNTIFRVQAGADHLHFANLELQNAGNGAWRVAGPVAGLHIERVIATNVHRLLEDYAGGGNEDASMTGLVLEDISVRGYARAVARITDDSSQILIEDVFGDSQAQQYSAFSTGLTFYETAHDATVRRAVMLNHQQLDVDGYWNADGFSSESGNYGLHFEDTYAAGNTDGGYDLKSIETLLTRAVAADNKRNFRFWGEGEFVDCLGLDPNKRGGSGTQAQVHVNPGASLVVTGSRFVDASAGTIVFDVDGDGVGVVEGGCVEFVGELQTVEEGGSLMLVGVDEGCSSF
ncbi:hypothetical protein G6O69_26915 [Pseudenhygromyxa sp. WMMC2535]|uniref:hypothetical protein n=1 Tax=Pseudenhygromyxa sp. WMMC2535 TaxID=2712867 RepID=UPI001552C0EC|nr:hypothetical protein [Pseudenhygromyxa sp. WMMC2535]NVB41499.1 hypothetical protein [Pseudenhygromyxa sp. WMMC2535]